MNIDSRIVYCFFLLFLIYIINNAPCFNESEDFTNKTVVFTKYFVNWCGHCKRLAPVWKQLENEYSTNSNVQIKEIDCEVQPDLAKQNNVRGYPTLILTSGSKSEKYNGPRTLNALKQFVETKL